MNMKIYEKIQSINFKHSKSIHIKSIIYVTKGEDAQDHTILATIYSSASSPVVSGVFLNYLVLPTKNTIPYKNQNILLSLYLYSLPFIPLKETWPTAIILGRLFIFVRSTLIFHIVG